MIKIYIIAIILVCLGFAVFPYNVLYAVLSLIEIIAGVFVVHTAFQLLFFLAVFIKNGFSNRDIYIYPLGYNSFENNKLFYTTVMLCAAICPFIYFFFHKDYSLLLCIINASAYFLQLFRYYYEYLSAELLNSKYRPPKIYLKILNNNIETESSKKVFIEIQKLAKHIDDGEHQTLVLSICTPVVCLFLVCLFSMYVDEIASIYALTKKELALYVATDVEMKALFMQMDIYYQKFRADFDPKKFKNPLKRLALDISCEIVTFKSLPHIRIYKFLSDALNQLVSIYPPSIETIEWVRQLTRDSKREDLFYRCL